MQIGEQVYIKPEYYSVNPLIESFSHINRGIWRIISISSEKYAENINKTINTYNIENNGFIVNLGEHCLISVHEVREQKLNKIIE